MAAHPRLQADGGGIRTDERQIQHPATAVAAVIRMSEAPPGARALPVASPSARDTMAARPR